MIRVLLYTREPLLAAGLSSVLAVTDGLRVSGCCSALESVGPEARESQPGVLLLDVDSGIDLRLLRDLCVGLSGMAGVVLWQRVYGSFTLQALALGVRGVLLKTLPVEMVALCLARVASGGLWVDSGLADVAVARPAIPLTRREGQLVSALSQGMTNRQIACALGITEGTVKVCMSRLFIKLGVANRFELALWGPRNLASAAAAAPADGFLAQPVRSLFVESGR